MPGLMFGGNQALLITDLILSLQYPYSEARWWHHLAVGMFFSEKDEFSNVQRHPG